MTHFTVIVRVPEARLRNTKLADVLATMLEPYNEQTEDPRYRVFKDTTDEKRREYETESVTRVKGPDGVLRPTWDDLYRVPGTFGMGTGTHSHDLPGHTEVEVFHREEYATFEDYLRDYCDEELNEAGRVGYMHNPQGKWDSWVIGGRWLGRLPTRSGDKDAARAADLDHERIAELWERKIADFHREYIAPLGGEKFRPWDGPRDRAIEMGLMRVERGSAIAGPGEVVLPWRGTVRPDDARQDWNDVAKVVTLDELRAGYGAIFHPIAPLVVVDENGWHEAGRNGWFGMNDATPDALLSFKRQFVEVLLPSLDPTDTLVSVDAHV